MSNFMHSVTQHDVLTPTLAKDKAIELGTLAWGRYGNLYRYCKTKTAIAQEGQCLIEYVCDHANITAPANTDSAPVYFTDAPSITVTAGELSGANAFVYGNTGVGYKGVIKEHPAASSGSSRRYEMMAAFGGALHTDSDILVHKPGLVDLATTDNTQHICGVSVCAVTDEYYFWALVMGYGYVLLDAASPTDAYLLRPSNATAGSAEVDSGTWAADTSNFARILKQGGASLLSYCWINCLSL